MENKLLTETRLFSRDAQRSASSSTNTRSAARRG